MHQLLLVEPPFYRLFHDRASLLRYPLGLGFLAGAVLQSTEWEVGVLNADFTPSPRSFSLAYMADQGFRHYREGLGDYSRPAWRELRRVLEEREPEVVGISAKSQNFASACTAARIAKEVRPEALVIVGGPHPSMVGAEVLECEAVDVAVRGEGERTLVELLQAHEAGASFGRVPGISFREGARVLTTPDRELMDDLSSLPFPHQSAPQVLVGYEHYPRYSFRNVFASRGCPFNCFFCGSREIWGRRVRHRRPENVAEEIAGLSALGLRTVNFDDDTFGVDRGHLEALCSALEERCPEVRWSCEVHAKLVDDEFIARIKRAGCYSINLGIESGSDEILAAMRKGITVEEALAACATIKRHGIDLQAFFMIGFPQETETTIRQTLDAMKSTSADEIICSVFTPYPGTEAFTFCREHGLIGDEYDPSLHSHAGSASNFVLDIERRRFRELASEVQREVDRMNRWGRLRRAASPLTLRRLGELGIGQSLRRGLDLVLGR